MHIHDLIGIGFGPSNLALAIALQERSKDSAPIDSLFIERQPSFAWHPNMLLDHTHMQISFLKDLVTLRNPASPYTFLAYLHARRRLQDFINLKTFYPSRHEFNDYLGWAASHFTSQCAYDEDVIEILPEMRGDTVAWLRVRSRSRTLGMRERLTRSLAIGVGGAPNIPQAFASYKGHGRVFHSSAYLSNITRVLSEGAINKVAVVGAGQSAAEIFLDLHGRGVDVDLITRARSIKPSDDSPFVNEIFNPEFTDYVFHKPGNERAAMLDEFMNTNYAAPDLALIEQIYNVFYRQKVAGSLRHRFLRQHEVQRATADGQGIGLALVDLDAGQPSVASYDAVVLATGYVRNTYQSLLAPLSAHLGDFTVDRHYRLQTPAHVLPSIFLQGCSESTHGLSDTLLSVTSVRSGEISQVLGEALADFARDGHRALYEESKHLALAT
ncbi:lysine N(6)-hydroxylase/L-ornithine N(5)-oxygenase family protein [Paucibacter sp. XJ19-41]|uniref:lysine N(6)-hydroxylase/L-ornithine N(5)-oxygenase family protein n=1 Tax=Paucibacter sp. XJ19-41 TaxID=2927824 RepID=UPI00234BEBF6|nr:lysine N(6)-hydroxylase/L-ornithine N(5)-oxygenase family protein [Paucibacter sp. XJ19-41]MDC6169762.1 lysine N(6)-hydroxylase/L-ornithine N(5)-oxygenase family protein [Paucibacter sp. XJ19-41]